MLRDVRSLVATFKANSSAGAIQALASTIALSIIPAFILIAIFADVIAPHPPNIVNLEYRLTPPVWASGGTTTYLLGTDDLGRDILSRVIYGSRGSLTVAVAALSLGVGLGSLLGFIAGAVGGLVEATLMRLVDAMLTLPVILYGLLFAVVLGPSFINVVLAIALGVWPRFARQVRGDVVSLRERDYVVLARIANASRARLILRHFLPNVFNTLVVLATLQVGQIIIIEASLSFLGAGIPPPAPTWGGMVARGGVYFQTAAWMAFFPGLAIMLTVLAVNISGDWLRDRLDPRLRQV